MHTIGTYPVIPILKFDTLHRTYSLNFNKKTYSYVERQFSTLL